MEQKVKILVVEDEMLIGAKIALFLTELGYEVTALLPRAEEALQHVAEDLPDLALLDIQLRGDMDGIALAELLHSQHNLPVIFLTANTDDATFQRAKVAKPFAFLAKPFRKTELQRALELAITRMATATSPDSTATPPTDDDNAFLLDDRIFVRFKDRMVKILFDTIRYVEADRNYCRIFTPGKEYLLTMPMKSIEAKLPAAKFQRIHRSHIVNLAHVDEVSEGHVHIGDTHLPLSQSLREEFLKRIKLA
jgi:DNA-binding LytR/AlgR family response regulator